jgi:hypothetical protein
MFNTKKDNKVKKSASKADRRSKKSTKMDQQPQESTLEEIDYLKSLQAESEDEHEETGHYLDDKDLSAGEDELPSESRLRTHQDDARVSEADEDKTQSVSNKKRSRQDSITGITSRFSLT